LRSISSVVRVLPERDRHRGLLLWREGRSITYRVDVPGMRALIDFLVTDCCDGHPELCGFAKAEKDCGCGTPSKNKQKK
jgi:ArsR family transcriptional regulator, arsenate/arsenite/antimonite-responsive transcriptional repressor